MKKILAGVLLYTLIACPVFAEGFGYGYKYRDRALFYTNVDEPVSVTHRPVSSIRGLKEGTSMSKNFFGLVEVGNAGIAAAANNGNIRTVEYVDIRKEKLLIPLVFIPIFVSKTVTKVYGR